MSELTAVCELTEDGMRQAQTYLKSIREFGWMPLPTGLLSDRRYSEPLEAEAYVEPRSFADRREAGQYLAQQLGPLAAAGVVYNPYLWSWLSIFYLEEVTKRDIHTARRINEYPEAAYLIDPVNRDSRDRSHHRLLIAYDVWTRHGEDAWLLLNDPVSTLSQFTLRLVQAPEVFRSQGIVRLAHLLYADPKTGGLRKGTRGMSNAAAPPGSLPRLLAVLYHLSMTYDVYGMRAEDLLGLLPKEFDSFRSRVPTA